MTVWKDVRESDVQVRPSQAEARCPSGSQSKRKLGIEVCWYRWTMLVSLDYTGVLLTMLVWRWLCWHVAGYAGI